MNPPAERRHFLRFAMEAEVQIEDEHGAYQARLLDISLNGALVTLPLQCPCALGDAARLSIRLPESDVVITMEGRVAHRGKDVLGYRCEHIDLASISHLKRLIELNLGDEGQLERELSELIAVHSS
ncbi:MAG: PilZ domain-containing protein [Thiohalomonadaceae bacterium]